MPTSRAIFQAHVDGVLPESVPLDLQWSLFGTVLQILYPVTIANGDNTLSVPSGTSVIILKPPTTNGNTWKLKGAGGDTGKTLNSNLPNVITHESGTTILNSSGITSNVLIAYLA